MSRESTIAAKRVEATVTNLVMTEPFYASLALQLAITESHGETSTMATDGTRMFYHPDFIAACKDRELRTPVVEEVLHNAMGHRHRAPEAADWETWNRACDQEIRWMLVEENEKAAQRHEAEPFPFPFPEKSLPDPQYRGMAAEAVYGRMMAEKDAQRQQPEGQGQGEGTGEGLNTPGQGQKPSQGQPGQSGGQLPPQPGEDGSWGEFQKPTGSQSERQQEKEQWQQATLQAARLAKGRGNLPSAIAKLVEEIIQPKTDWRQLLRDFMTEITNADWCWSRPNLRYAHTEFILPSLRSEKLGKVFFATDTSGSIFSEPDILAAFQGAKQQVLDELTPTALVDIMCDAEIQKVTEYTPGDVIDKETPGGGGTDFRPVFDHLEKEEETPLCLIFLTDLDGTFPEQDPGYPVLWVTWEKPREVPFGTVVKMER